MRTKNVMNSNLESMNHSQLQTLVREVHKVATSADGPYSDPKTHDAVWKECNRFLHKLINKGIKCD